MYASSIFITGIGTDVGKTVVAAIVTESLRADYWKPIQAGFADGTDSEKVASLVSNPHTIIHPEVYKLTMPASPHIAAREEGVRIDLDLIHQRYKTLTPHPPANHGAGGQSSRPLIIEGAGGLMVPLNDDEFVIDLIEKLGSKVILVSRNYLGSINHSLLTAAMCRQRNIPVLGWIFNDVFGDYEEEIVQWTGIPVLGRVGWMGDITNRRIESIAGIDLCFDV
jgi:dethiobiotin synthetase